MSALYLRGLKNRQELVAAVYDACMLLVEVYDTDDILDVYDEMKLPDGYNFRSTASEICNLIAEGSIK
ncbi:hypothetical protein EB118_08115 [bacterium]|nr:hypothetical protein [bacterium]